MLLVHTFYPNSTKPFFFHLVFVPPQKFLIILVNSSHKESGNLKQLMEYGMILIIMNIG